MADEAYIQETSSQLTLYTTLLAGMLTAGAESDSIKDIQEYVFDLSRTLQTSLQPWLDFEDPENEGLDRKQEVYNTLANKWTETFGSTDDPEVQARIQNTVDFLKKGPTNDEHGRNIEDISEESSDGPRYKKRRGK